MEKNTRLGRGLSALMGEDDEVYESAPTANSEPPEGISFVDVEDLVPSPYQPRRVFATDALADLVLSIKEKGVLQPLLVRKNPKKSTGYEIIAGERRFRASKMAGLKTVPVIIKQFSNKDALEVALIENLQREDLNPLEEAESYKRLLQEFKYTQEELSKVIGKSRSHLSNMMRLLELPDEIKQMVEKKELTVGHARALLSAQDPISLAMEVLKKGYSVRKTERLASKKGSGLAKSRQSVEKPDDIIVLENELSSVLAAKLTIKWNGHAGDIQIKCDNLDKLDAILQRLSIGGPLE
ncbi:MAG: ParB/RepB/Spo0J family partition protein [Alphaproteobacteria bacterium]|nr:ParB/RepB/Spo0J family partition protein [Alphaproteobacteria bacterium]